MGVRLIVGREATFFINRVQRYEKFLIYANFGERKNDVFGYFYEKKESGGYNPPAIRRRIVRIGFGHNGQSTIDKSRKTIDKRR